MSSHKSHEKTEVMKESVPHTESLPRVEQAEQAQAEQAQAEQAQAEQAQAEQAQAEQAQAEQAQAEQAQAEQAQAEQAQAEQAQAEQAQQVKTGDDDDDLLDEAYDKVLDLGEKAYETGKNFAADQINTAVDYVAPNFETMSNEQAKQELRDKAAKLNAVMIDLAEDPEVQQLIEDTGDAFGKLTEDLMDAIEQPVMDMTDRGLDLVSNIALTSGRTLGKTGVDLVMSVLGEVPGVGGLVDLGVTTLVVFNGLARNIMIGVDNITKMVTIANKLTGDVLDPISDSIGIIQGLENRATAVYDSIDEKLDELNREYMGVGQSAEQPTPGDSRLTQPVAPQEPDTREALPPPPPPSAYVDTRLSQEPVQQAAEPVQQAAEPVQQAAEPFQQAAEPVQQAAEPFQQAAEPVQQAAEPVPQVTESVPQVSEPVPQAEPVPQVTEPVQQVTEPVQQVTESVPQVSEPVQQARPTQVSEPVPQVTEPVQHVTEPVQQARPTQVSEPVQQVTEPVPQVTEPVQQARPTQVSEPVPQARPTQVSEPVPQVSEPVPQVRPVPQPRPIKKVTEPVQQTAMPVSEPVKETEPVPRTTEPVKEAESIEPILQTPQPQLKETGGLGSPQLKETGGLGSPQLKETGGLGSPQPQPQTQKKRKTRRSEIKPKKRKRIDVASKLIKLFRCKFDKSNTFFQ